MPHTPTTWVDAVTSATAARMNNLETGVVNAEPHRGTTAPSSPVTGKLWEDTNTSPAILKAWTGSTWENVGSSDSYSLGLTDSVTRTITIRLREGASVKDFGAVGNGTTDDTTAIQNAIDSVSAAGGGILFVPKTTSYYRITQPLYMEHNVRMVGEGYKSCIKNDITSTGGVNPKSACFLFGNYNATETSSAAQNANHFTLETYYAATPPSRNDATITFTTAADAANFAVGDIALIHNNTFLTGYSHSAPSRAEINEVTAVNTGAGTITLKHPLSDDYSPCRVAKSGGAGMVDKFGNTVRVVKRSSLENLRLENDYANSLSWGVLAYGGNFECTFRDLYIRGNAFMANNGISRATVDNIRGEVARKTLDISYFSHDSTFTNFRVSRIVGAPQDDRPVGLAEGAHDCVIRDHKYDVGEMTSNTLLTVATGSRRNLVDGFEGVGTHITGSLCNVSGDFPNGAPAYNTLRQVRLWGGSATRGFYIQGSSSTPAHNVLDGCEVHGTTTSPTVELNATSQNNVVRNCRFPDGGITDAGTGNRIYNNITSAGFVSGITTLSTAPMYLPTGAIAISIPRNQATSQALTPLSSGRLGLFAIELPSGATITSITFVSGTTAMVTPANQWFTLYNSSRALLRATADDTTAAWAVSASKTLNLSSTFTTTYSGLHYVGIVIVAATLPSLTGMASNVAATGPVPILAGSSNTGLTTPGTAPSTANAITAQGSSPLVWVS